MLLVSQSDDPNLAAVLQAINESLRALTDAVQALYASHVETSRSVFELSVAMEKTCSQIYKSEKEIAELLLQSLAELSAKLDLIRSGSSPYPPSSLGGGGKVQ